MKPFAPVYLLAAVLLVSAACNLGTAPADDAAPTSAIPTWEVNAATQAACVPRTDWPVYTVQPRDNLTIIANLTGSSIDELAAANCLQNQNRLLSGQTLYVPTLPGAGCDASLLTGTGQDYVLITPSVDFNDACYTLSGGQPVTLNWFNAPSGAAEVTFYRRSAATEREAVLGIDNTPGDGFVITWTVPADLTPSVVLARVTVGTGSGTSDPVGISLE